jgi:hypothetical protein
MGRADIAKPNKRQMLVARQLHPEAWSDNAEGHIKWAKDYKLDKSTCYFGGQFLLIRRLALIQAELLLRLLDRQAKGLSDLTPLDARALKSDLDKRYWKLDHRNPRITISHKAVDATFFMNSSDGIPAPKSEIDDTGNVTLTWKEGNRSARVDIDKDGAMLLTISPSSQAPMPLDFSGW